MKRLPIFGILAILIGTSCGKQANYQMPGNPATPRKVEFSLYSDKDFSGNNNNIVFKVFIQQSANLVLWDSTLAPMKIKDIPGMANKLVIQKLVPNNDGSLLKVGFSYAIENVGSSQYIEAFNANELFKSVVFNFQ